MKIGISNIERKAIFPPFLIIILLIGVWLTGKGYREGPMDFRAGRWGDSPQDVIGRESSAGFTPAGDMKPDGDSVVLVFQDMTIMDYRCDVAYRFTSAANPLLVAGEYRFHRLTNSFKKQLTATLESKYGRPVETSENRQVYEVPRTTIIFDLKVGRLIHEKNVM